MPTKERPERVTVPLLFGGLSQQHPSVRFPHQLEDASNAVFSVSQGASKRPGTVFVRNITGLTGTHYRLHGIDRGDGEEYAVVYGSNNVATTEFHVFELGNNNLKATVSVSSYAQTYLDTLGADQVDGLRLSTTADYTLIANVNVATTLAATDSYTVQRSWRDFDILASLSTTDGYYFRTEKDTDQERAGYWKYDVGGITFAHANFTTLTETTSKFLDVGAGGYWKTAANNPMGFKIAFGRFGPFTITSGATWASSSATSGTLSRTGAFTNYVFGAEDTVYVGTDIADSTGPNNYKLKAGWYRVSARASANGITVEIPSVTGAPPADTVPLSTTSYKDSAGATVTEAFIGAQYEVVADMRGYTLADMQDVALVFQQVLRAAGAAESCCLWYGRGDRGAFQITSPYRGTSATCYNTAAPTNASTVDLSAAGKPFDKTSSTLVIYNGTGSVANDLDTLPPASRWTRVAPPGQSGGKLFTSTSAVGTAYGMPVQMVRQNTSRTGGVASYTIGASPCTVTMDAAHNLVVGQSLTITGDVGGGGVDINGTFTVLSTPSTTQITITKNTTGGTSGGAGTWTAPAYFTIDVVAWNQRVNGDSTSNPAPKPFRDGLPVRDLCFHRGRLALMMGETVTLSQANDLFNFFNDDDRQVVDSDPVTAPLSTDRVTTIAWAVPWRTSMTLFTLAGRQFDFAAPVALTPSTAGATTSTSYRSLSVRPKTMQGRIYFLSSRGDQVQLLEYFYDDLALASDAAVMTKHVPELLPLQIVSLLAVEESNTVLVIPQNSDSILVYQVDWSAPRTKQQSAWGSFDFDPSYLVQDAATIAGRLYMLTKTANLWFLERLPLTDESMSFNYEDIADPAPTITEPYTTHLDRRFYLASGTGTYNATDGRTVYDLGVQTPASTINRAVLLSTGEERNVVYWSGTSIGVSGDTSGVAVIVGCAYTMSLELSRPYLRDENGRALQDVEFLTQYLTVVHHNTGQYLVRVVRNGSAGARREFDAPGYSVEDGTGSFPEARGGVGPLRYFIESDSARPCTIVGYELVGDVKEGFRSEPN